MWCPNRECVDFEEIGEPGEYRDDIELCPKCGACLVHERPDWGTGSESDVECEAEEAIPDGPLVAAARFRYRQEADLAASMLWANGVPAVVFAGPSGNDPRMEFGAYARVMVSDRDAEVARTLLGQEPDELEPGEA